jgi:cytochrome P450
MDAALEEFDIDLLNGPRLRGNAIIEDCNLARERAPVFWRELSQTWIVGRHEDVCDGFQGRVPLANRGRSANFALMAVPKDQQAELVPNLHGYLPNWIVDVDPPQHTRLRKLVMSAFTKRVVENLRGYSRERVGQLLDKAERQIDIEFNEQIASPLPGNVIFKLFGLPNERFSDLRDWTNAVVGAMTTPGTPLEALQACDQALGEMNALVTAELGKRSDSPRDDLLTKLLQATQDGETLTLDELLGAMHIFIVAGHDSTANTMALGTEALSRHPEAWEYMRSHPDEIMNCVNELMRYVVMSAGQPRIVAEDFEWHGQHLRKGQPVALLIAGANRDPRVFDDPEILDFKRDNSAMQVFAPGVHHCIGHLLAKMQLCEYFSALVDRFEGLEVLDEELDFMPAFVFRGLYGMNVRFHPRKH